MQCGRKAGGSNRAASVILVLDGRSKSDFSGTAYSTFYAKSVAFRTTSELLTTLDSLYQALNCPQPTVRLRRFQPNPAKVRVLSAVERPENMEKILSDTQKATFVVNVLFQQNASWQGTISWINQGKTQPFRSLLELLKLMDSATSENGVVEVVDWDGDSSIAPGIWPQDRIEASGQ